MVQGQRVGGNVGRSDSEGKEGPMDIVTYINDPSGFDIALGFVKQCQITLCSCDAGFELPSWAVFYHFCTVENN